MQMILQNVRVVNLAIDQYSRSCTYTLFLPQGVEIKFIIALQAAVSKVGPIFYLAILGHETWHVAKVPEVAQ